MTDPSSATDCNVTCSPTGSRNPSCGCSATSKSQKAKTAKYGAGFITLCAICCAVPPALIALGLIGITTAAYLNAGSKVALIVLAVLGVGHLWMQYVKKNR